MINIEPSLIQAWSDYSKIFINLLKNLYKAIHPLEFKLSSFDDPFLTIRVLIILSTLQA
jgi:hypothetical protein